MSDGEIAALSVMFCGVLWMLANLIIVVTTLWRFFRMVVTVVLSVMFFPFKALWRLL
jgi:hypothetical protein